MKENLKNREVNNKAIFKFNSGNLALLCSNCGTIIKIGYQFTKEECKASKGEIKLSKQICKNCKNG